MGGRRRRGFLEDGGVLVLAVAGEALVAALEPALVSPRKYQQRLRCIRLPPTVAMARSCGVAASRTASEDGQARGDGGVALDVRQRGERADAQRAVRVEAQIAQRARRA